MHHIKLYSCAFIKIEGRRLGMLRGLPGIRHKLAKLACTILVTSKVHHHVLHMVHPAYLNEMQDASV